MAKSLDQLRTDLTSWGFAALNRMTLPIVKAGLGTPLPYGVGVVVLETTGRVSGQPRQVPLLAVRCGSHINVSTVRGDSQWVKNLQARPEAAVWVGGRKREISSTVDTGALTVANLELS